MNNDEKGDLRNWVAFFVGQGGEWQSRKGAGCRVAKVREFLEFLRVPLRSLSQVKRRLPTGGKFMLHLKA